MILSLVATGIALLVTQSIGKETAIVFGNWIFLPISGALVVLSIISAKKYGITGSHGKAWICFAVFSVMWFIAEQVWLILELLYHQKPFPSFADIFYVAGYPAYFLFVILYLQPVKDAITKKMVITSSLVMVGVLVPNLYMALNNNSGEDQLTVALGLSYPILDAIILIPALIGVSLFFGGRVNFPWSLMLIGIIGEVAADTGFQYFSLDNSYYTGNLVDILFLWSYILLAFGVYDHIKIFNVKQKSLFDKESLR
jgi:hypothetical protein